MWLVWRLRTTDWITSCFNCYVATENTTSPEVNRRLVGAILRTEWVLRRVPRSLMRKCVNDKTSRRGGVSAATIELLSPYYKATVLTKTADNGKEFAYHEDVIQALGAAVYFADSYSSWRGLNENTNGLLRQYWPKKTDFKKGPPCLS